jgi:transcription elongation factor GreA
MQAAKERQRLVESRISMLQKRVSEIHLHQRRSDSRPTAAGSARRCTSPKSNGEKTRVPLVMPEDADAAKGLISTTSPIGRALLNKEAGDSVKVVTPGGHPEFDIDRLSTIHDEAPNERTRRCQGRRHLLSSATHRTLYSPAPGRRAPITPVVLRALHEAGVKLDVAAGAAWGGRRACSAPSTARSTSGATRASGRTGDRAAVRMATRR